jgi:hypothetical protein
VSAIRGTFGLLTFVLAGVLAGGCEPPIPSLPAAPEVPEAPDAPETPEQLKAKGGNCCIRSGKMLKSRCNGKACCVPKLDEDACESAKGFWFFSPEGCAGAC